MRFHYLREQVGKGKLKLEHYRSEYQVAAIITKGVKIETFMKLRGLTGMEVLANLRWCVEKLIQFRLIIS